MEAGASHCVLCSSEHLLVDHPVEDQAGFRDSSCMASGVARSSTALTATCDLSSLLELSVDLEMAEFVQRMLRSFEVDDRRTVSD